MKLGICSKLFITAMILCSFALFSSPSFAKITKNENYIIEHIEEVKDGSPFLINVALTPNSNLNNLDDFKVVWRGKTVPLKGQGKSADALLSIPVDSKEKTYIVEVFNKNSKIYSSKITVKGIKYPTQELTVEPKFVNPPAGMLDRIRAESAENRKILQTVSPFRYWEFPFQRPVPGIITSEFGFRRVFNGVPKSPHKAVDFRGAEGVAIKSCEDGKVALAKNNYYSGNLVILDHGLGVYTLYAHMSRMDVKVGDVVSKGQVIGLVGKTGRVTGPHLHLGLSVLGESVTPEFLIDNFRTK